MAFFAFSPQGSLTTALMEGATNGITLSISLAGNLCLWCGVANVMEIAGVQRWLAKVFTPLFRKIFPKSSHDTQALEAISANFSANLLGLGNAATPLGIAATKRIQHLNGHRAASHELCRLVVMNTASIQLLPTTVAALRSAHGSQNPFSILPAVWVTSLASVGVGLFASWLLEKVWRAS